MIAGQNMEDEMEPRDVWNHVESALRQKYPGIVKPTLRDKINEYPTHFGIFSEYPFKEYQSARDKTCRTVSHFIKEEVKAILNPQPIKEPAYKVEVSLRYDTMVIYVSQCNSKEADARDKVQQLYMWLSSQLPDLIDEYVRNNLAPGDRELYANILTKGISENSDHKLLIRKACQELISEDDAYAFNLRHYRRKSR
jgi:hypothetical protein